jgi:hypothetical protein
MNFADGRLEGASASVLGVLTLIAACDKAPMPAPVRSVRSCP